MNTVAGLRHKILNFLKKAFTDLVSIFFSTPCFYWREFATLVIMTWAFKMKSL